MKKASSLKKAELAALLEDVILRSLESICSKFDSERFGLLLEVAKRGGYMEAPSLEWEQWKYFREYGILYTGVFKEKNCCGTGRYCRAAIGIGSEREGEIGY